MNSGDDTSITTCRNSGERSFWFEGTNKRSFNPDTNADQDQCSKELSIFLDGSTRLSKARSLVVAKAAINLLKHTWTASDAVLEHTENLFDESVNNYILNLEIENNSGVAPTGLGVDEGIIHEMHSVLCEFIESEPEVWAPLISTWSLNLLGRLSSKYANHRVVPHSQNLPEVLQLWMTCRTTRALIELATKCLSTLINSNPDSCIDALIETSVLHSPHFDWVVAHIGSCFPVTIITRVLACGLKDFCQHQDSEDLPSTSVQSKTPKIASVVGILGHLAIHHPLDMRSAINCLFNESLLDTASREQLATGPFLLQLASMSDVLSDVISSQFVSVVSPETLNTMSCQVEKWKTAKIPGTDGLIHLVVHLLLRSDGGCQVIRCLLDIMPPSKTSIHSVIRDAAGLVLDSVLLEIQRRVYAGAPEIPLLHFLKSHISDLSSNLYEVEGKKANWVFNLIKLVCIHGSDTFTISILSQLLNNTEKPSPYLPMLAQEIVMAKPNAISITIAHQMAELKSGRFDKPVALVKNLTSLFQAKQLSKIVRDAVVPNLEVLASQITEENMDYSNAMVELISAVVVTEEMSMASLYKVAGSSVNYLFSILSASQLDPVKKIGWINVVKGLLSKLCCQTATQHMVLRMILEGILEKKYALLFDSNFPKINASKKGSADISLMDENIKYMSSITLPPNHCSVFYSGVIGSGLRTFEKVPQLPKDEKLLNKQVVLDVIQSCCKPSWRFPLDESPNCHPQSLVPGMKIVALLLVEMISPDVMFNGLPWPDEDYLKVTVERDLHIKQMFETHSILWDLLLLVATIHPSLCYCSVLLRAIMAVLISYWSSNQEKRTTNSPKQLEMTQRLISIMAIGQILPPPLSYIDEILQFVTPYEAFSLLTNIWQYMRENVPSPALFSALDKSMPRVWRNFEHSGNGNGYCDKKYTNRLRFIMFANIEKFGPMYAKFFPIE